MTATETPMRLGDRLMRVSEVVERTSFCKSAIYKMMQREDHPFPQPIRLSQTCVRWLESEVAEWIAAMASSRV